MEQLAILLLAAGASSRMNGRDKLLEPINGIPLLAVMIARAQATGVQVFVTLPDQNSPRLPLVPADATPVFVADAATGMAASLRAGIAALPADCTAVMIVPADMPDLQFVDLKHMIQEFPKGAAAPILRATTQSGQHGHPVILPHRFFAEAKTLTGDRGASPLLRKYADQVCTISLKGDRAIIDLDTPEDWAKWREHHQTTS